MIRQKLLLLAALHLFLAAQLAAQATESALLDAFFKKAERYGWSGSALVARGGKTLLENGYGWQDREAKTRQRAETVFSIGSITKQFTGAAIVKLEMQGKLRVGDPLRKFFPDAPADKADITLHQLLTHTAGCPDALGDDYELIDAEAFMQRFFKTPLRSAPGSEHQYSNVGYSVLGIIVEKISGMGYEKYCYENLWRPAGMERTGYLRPGHKAADLAVGYRNGERWGTALDRAWLPDGPGWHLRANGGVLSTVGDMHRWFAALQGEAVLDAAAKAQYLKAQVRECPDCPSFYAYGWVSELSPDNQRFMWHNGGNGVYNAFMGFEPATGLCVLISSNSNDKIADDYLPKIRQILAGEAGGLSEKTAEKFTGAYRLPGGSLVNVRFDELDRLRADWDDAAALQILSGDGSEDPVALAPVLARSAKIAEDTRANRHDDMAKAMGLPPEEAAEQGRIFWEMQEKMGGKVLRTEPIGTVARPGRGAVLAFVRVVMERKTRYLTFVWRGEELADFRVSDRMDKEFEMEGPDEFFAPNNQLRAFLQADGSILLRSRAGQEVILGKK